MKKILVLFLFLAGISISGEAGASYANPIAISSAVATDPYTVVLTFNQDVNDAFLSNYYNNIVSGTSVYQAGGGPVHYHVQSFVENNGVVTFTMQDEIPVYIWYDFTSFFFQGSSSNYFRDVQLETYLNVMQWPLEDGISPYIVDYDTDAADGYVGYDDVDGSGTINQWDRLSMIFSEQMDWETLDIVFDIDVRLGLSNGHTFGADSLSSSWSTDLIRDTFEIELGEGTTVASGDSINPVSGVTDIGGNADSTGSIVVPVSDNVHPIPAYAVSAAPNRIDVTFSEKIQDIVDKNHFTVNGYQGINSISSASKTSDRTVSLYLVDTITGSASITAQSDAVLDIAGNYVSLGNDNRPISSEDQIRPVVIDVSYSALNAVPGELFTVTATFNEVMAENPAVKIDISGANSIVGADMTMTFPNVFEYTYTVGAGSGLATVSFSTGQDMGGNEVMPTPLSGGTFNIASGDIVPPSAPQGLAIL